MRVRLIWWRRGGCLRRVRWALMGWWWSFDRRVAGNTGIASGTRNSCKLGPARIADIHFGSAALALLGEPSVAPDPPDAWLTASLRKRARSWRRFVTRAVQ